MANVVPYAFKQGILKADHDFTSAVTNYPLATNNAYNLALYDYNGGVPPYDVNDTSYSSAVANEVVGTGYTVGGKPLVIGTVGQTGNFSTVDWATNAIWTTATISAGYGVLYRWQTGGGTTANQFIVAILDFTGAKSSTAGTFEVVFPTIVTGGDAILSITGNP
jgi:hypothetical protein|tara:strand:+ start:22 stop:513 length:492 start_codon:yes stop_codon:yes gene_type:complete